MAEAHTLLAMRWGDYPISPFVRRHQGGSLPLKKRKFLDLCTGDLPKSTCHIHDINQSFPSQNYNGFTPSIGYRPTPSSRAASLESSQNTSTEDERVAAFALLATASASTPISNSEKCGSQEQQPCTEPLTPQPTRSAQTYFQLDSCPPSMISISPVASDRGMQTPTTTTRGLTQPRGGGASSSSSWHSPRLTSPLPNGCHGRTSRNNSFCRRTPCYKGSNYCKLHYQQYIVSGIRSPTAPSKIQGASSSSYSSASLDDTNGHEQQQQRVSIDGAPALPNIALQDKRFTGTGDEVRCLATTTRGRACAYVSVNSSKYCYLHADYDTNPPPKRGGTFSRQQQGQSPPGHVVVVQHGFSNSGDGHHASHHLLPSKGSHDRASLSTPDLLHPRLSPIPTPTTNDPCSAIPASSSSSSPPRVLLSMISTDLWYGKRVRITTGPMMDRTGTVEKWGNGWVSVQIPGVDGLHNRRSFELFVVLENDDENEQDDKTNQGEEEPPSSRQLEIQPKAVPVPTK